MDKNPKCRVCLHHIDIHSSEIVSIFTSNEVLPNYSNAEILKECTSVEVLPNDPYPKHICRLCSQKLGEVHRFIKLCQLADHLFKTYGHNVIYEHVNQEPSIDKLNTVLSSKWLLEDAFEEFLKRSQKYHNVTSKKHGSYSAKCFVCQEDLLFVRSVKTHVMEFHSDFYCEKCDRLLSSYNAFKNHFKHEHCDKRNNITGAGDIQGDPQAPTVPDVLERKNPDFMAVVSERKVKKELNNVKQDDAVKKESIVDIERVEKTEIEEVLKDIDEDVHFDYRNSQSLDVKKPEDHKVINVRGEHEKIKLVKCFICNKLTDALKQHVLDMHPELKCVKCNKKFMKFISLLRHASKHEKNLTKKRVKNSHCSVCNKSFYHKRSLQMHIKNSHRDGKQNEDVFNKRKPTTLCSYCGKTFISANYREHIRTHTGEKPYPCTVCNRSFSRSTSLASHSVQHTGIRRFGCETCGKFFSTSSKLTKHRRNHTGERPHSCHMCNERFMHRFLLKEHVLKHSNVQYKCEECDREFTYKKGLQEHSKKHYRDTGNWPYTCEICNRGQISLQSFKFHIERSHGNDIKYVDGKYIVLRESNRESGTTLNVVMDGQLIT